jgi:diguanylate cyclase (GGDEF)-like protein
MPEESVKVLLIEEEASEARRVQDLLHGGDYEIRLEMSPSLDHGLDLLARETFDVVLLGLVEPGALAVGKVDRVHSRAPEVPIIVLTALDETRVFLDTARGGAVDYLVKARLDRRELSRAVLYAVERRRMVEARARAEASLRHVVSSSADAMVVVDGEGVVRFVNPAAEGLFGRPAEEMVGQPFEHEVVPGMTAEVEIDRPGQESAIAEMRVVQTPWEGEQANLASLRDITDSVRMREELRTLSLRDELTGLYNRRGFITLAEQQLKLADRSGRGFLLFFADLDGLKKINDEKGHQEGDRALRRAAEVLKDTFRESDIVGRMGGDEFAVLAVGAGGAAEAVTARLQKALNARLQREDAPVPISLSAGCVRYDAQDPCSLDELLARADAAMYEQKRLRREGPTE